MAFNKVRNIDSKKLEKLERAVIGHALAYTTYLDYLGPRELSRHQNRHLRALFKATDNLRKYYRKYYRKYHNPSTQ